MIKGRDSKGHFIKGNVPWNKRSDSSPPAIANKIMTQGRDSRGRFGIGHVPHNKKTSSSPLPIASSMLIGGGAVKVDRVQVICPACGEQVEAIAKNGQVKGYCAIAMQYVDFRV